MVVAAAAVGAIATMTGAVATITGATTIGAIAAMTGTTTTMAIAQVVFQPPSGAIGIWSVWNLYSGGVLPHLRFSSPIESHSAWPGMIGSPEPSRHGYALVASHSQYTRIRGMSSRRFVFLKFVRRRTTRSNRKVYRTFDTQATCQK